MKYWIIINGAQLGPMEREELLALRPQPESPVWHEGLETWVAASTVPTLADYFRPTAVPEVPRVEEERQHYDEAHNTSDFHRGYNEGFEAGRASAHRQEAEYARNARDTRFYNARNPYTQQYGSEPVCPPTYLVWNIVAAILCCTIAGIVGIVFSAQVKSRFNAGDYAGAENASNIAMWSLILSIVLGLVGWPFYLLMAF